MDKVIYAFSTQGSHRDAEPYESHTVVWQPYTLDGKHNKPQQWQKIPTACGFAGRLRPHKIRSSAFRELSSTTKIST